MEFTIGTRAFWKVREARIIFWIFVANGIFMATLCEINCYNKLLGISHIIFWTPMLIWLAMKLSGFNRASGFGKWIVVLIVTDTLSLIVDFADVIRYILADRA